MRVVVPFSERLSRNGSCLEYQGARTRLGYGKYHVPGSSGSWKFAHRHAYEVKYGPIPTGLIVLHKCDNPPCCNPRHLRLGTYADNTDDARRKGRLAPPEATKHVGEDHGRAVLNWANVRAIRKEHASGSSCAGLSRRYGVTESQVRRIIRGVQWVETNAKGGK